MATIIAGVALAGIVALVLYKISRAKKSPSACGGGCAGCSGCASAVPPYEQER